MQSIWGNTAKCGKDFSWKDSMIRHLKEVCTGPEAFKATRALCAKDGEPCLRVFRVSILWQPHVSCTVSCVDEEGKDAVAASSVDVVVFPRVLRFKKKSIWT